MNIPTAIDLTAARRRLAGHAHFTPVLRSRQLDELANASLVFKPENLQRVGAFKFRGAFNAVASLEPDQRKRGVVTHSSGNHAQALALAARLHGVRANIVVPHNAPRIKLAAIRAYGATVHLCEPKLEAREREAQRLLDATEGSLIHAYDNPQVIAGQASAAAELLEQASPLDVVIAPVGGGGLLSGTALSSAYSSNPCRVIGAEPAGAADALRSLESGILQPSTDPRTIADGLRTQLSALTFGIIQTRVERIITATDERTIDAMRLIWERMKIVIEPSAAVAVAVALDPHSGLQGQRVGIILSGGNVDLDRLPWQ